jgi:TIR domain
MVQITSREELLEWLKDKPADWAQVIAVRAALRVLPLLFMSKTSTKWVRHFALTIFRAVNHSWSVANAAVSVNSRIALGATWDNLNHAISIAVGNSSYGDRHVHTMADKALVHRAEHDAVWLIVQTIINAVDVTTSLPVINNINYIKAITPAVDAVYNAIDLVEKAVNDFEDLFLTDSVKNLAGKNDINAILISVNADCNWLISSANQKLNISQFLSYQPLWPNIIPYWFQVAWRQAQSQLGVETNYPIWIQWFDRRIEGEPAAFNLPFDSDKALQKRISEQDNSFWDKGAAYVNATLQSWIDEARERVRSALPLSQSKPNFFISYSTKEEAMAREVEAILSERGYTSIAQFKDFPQGNFVKAMQDGIAGSDRFIALQSKAYWDSDHCRSEWAAAYARDPGAKQRKIVPFLLEDITLPPLASELVYKPLFKLTEAERRQAIIDWIEFQPPSHSFEELRKTLADVASPTVTLTNNKLDVIANAEFDGQTDTVNLGEPTAVLRAVVGALLGGLPGNAPRSFAANLTIYDSELAKRDAKPFLGVLVRMEKSVNAGFHADPEMFDTIVATNFISFFEAHLAFLTHYRRNEEREAKIAQFKIDDAAASGTALTGPVDEVAKEVAALAEQGLVTEGYAQAVKDQQEINTQIALYSSSLPTPSGEPSAKERHILQTVGFYERSLAIASNAITVAKPLFAFIKILKEAIEALLKFFV